MCIARVGKVIVVSNGKAKVQFFDNTILDDVNVSMVEAERDSYLEIYANLALAKISTKEASSRKKDWLTIRKAAGLTT